MKTSINIWFEIATKAKRIIFSLGRINWKCGDRPRQVNWKQRLVRPVKISYSHCLIITCSTVFDSRKNDHVFLWWYCTFRRRKLKFLLFFIFFFSVLQWLRQIFGWQIHENISILMHKWCFQLNTDRGVGLDKFIICSYNIFGEPFSKFKKDWGNWKMTGKTGWSNKFDNISIFLTSKMT